MLECSEVVTLIWVEVEVYAISIRIRMYIPDSGWLQVYLQG